MHKGRPTKQQSKQIRDQIWSCFTRGLDPLLAIQKTGISKNTVYYYYNQWEKQFFSDEKFQEQFKQEKQRVVISYNHLILELDESLNEIKKEIKSYNTKKESIPRYLYGHHLQYVKEISNLIEKRTTVRMMPPLEEQIKEMIAEQLEKKNVNN